MTERPGFMLYFDLVDALQSLDDVQAGQLFKALMAYAQTGEVRELTGLADFAFRFARPRIDRDAEIYQEKCRKNAYNAYVGTLKRRGETPMEYEAWVWEQSDAIGCDRMPTITQHNAAAASTAASTRPNAAGTPTGSQKTKTTVFSTTGGAAADAPGGGADTAWVVPYLEDWKKKRINL